MSKTSTKLVELMREEMRSNGFNSDYPIDVAEHNGTL